LNNKTYVKSWTTSDKRIAARMEVEWKSRVHAQQYLGIREDIPVRQVLES